MNRFFDFSREQMRTLVVLAVIVVMAGSYKFIRDYYIKPLRPASAWKISQIESLETNLKVDLNYSPADSLELVPSLGPILSQRIIDYRAQYGKFPAVDSIVNVLGIGEAKLKQIKPYLKVTMP
ncbi:MAG: helix-hairpin-helix domain-containing protein [candidate division Zixibacteria bacterium]